MTRKRIATLARIALGLLAFDALAAHASIIRVGQSGAAGGCDASSLQEALDRVAASRAPNEIRVSRDVDDETWTDQHLVANGIDAVIVGGYATCADDAPSGHSRIAGTQGGPLLTLRGTIALELRGLDLKGGTASEADFGGVIDFQGNGSLRLDDASVSGASSTHPARAALGIRGVIDASLHVGDDVEVVDNLTSGLMAIAHARLDIRGERVSFSRNAGDGLLLQNIEAGDIALADSTISNNAGYALRYHNPEWPVQGDGVVRLRSLGAWAPLRIEGNGAGAILVTATNRARTLCMNNVTVSGHVLTGSPQGFDASVIRADGGNARFSNDCDAMGGANDIPCMAAACNTIADNVSSGPTISATGGATVRLEKLFLLGNSAPTIVAANDDHRAGESFVTVGNSLFAYNDVGRSIASTEHLATMFIGATTIAANGGPFAQAFEVDEGGRLLVGSSIVDEESPLLESDGSDGQAVFTTVLARNAGDAWPGEGVFIGRPSFRGDTFELEPTSLGVDLAAAQGGLDIRGGARDVVRLEVPDARWPRDLGAFETQAPRPAPIFDDGFEGSSARQDGAMPMPRTRRASRMSR